MKRLLFVIGVAVVIFIIYAMLSEEPGPPPTRSTPTLSQPVTSPTPAAPNVVQQAQQAVGQSNAARATQSPNNLRSAEVRQIILQCAQRAGWTITNYQQTAYGVSRVTGRAPNDNVRNQRFLDEIQRSGILRDIETGPSRAYVDGRGVPILESTIIIKWQ